MATATIIYLYGILMDWLTMNNYTKAACLLGKSMIIYGFRLRCSLKTNPLMTEFDVFKSTIPICYTLFAIQTNCIPQEVSLSLSSIQGIFYRIRKWVCRCVSNLGFRKKHMWFLIFCVPSSCAMVMCHGIWCMVIHPTNPYTYIQ